MNNLWLIVIGVIVSAINFHFRTAPPHNTNLTIRNEDSLANNDLLILTIVKDAKSWGRERTFHDHLKIIESLGYPTLQTSLGFLVSDAAEFERVKSVLQSTELEKRYKKVTLIKKDFPVHITREQRHASWLQKARRSIIARARNNLLMAALDDEQFVLWIDADIVDIPFGILQKMIASGKDIITPRCRIAPDEDDYDLNAWQGPRTKPSKEDRKQMALGAVFIPNRVQGVTKHLGDFMRADPNRTKEFVKLDSVGGTMLFVKSEVHKQGVIFPTEYIVGTTWKQLGYDGIETEGLCYLAKTIGASCWGMPHVAVEHDAS